MACSGPSRWRRSPHRKVSGARGRTAARRLTPWTPPRSIWPASSSPRGNGETSQHRLQSGMTSPAPSPSHSPRWACCPPVISPTCGSAPRTGSCERTGASKTIASSWRAPGSPSSPPRSTGIPPTSKWPMTEPTQAAHRARYGEAAAQLGHGNAATGSPACMRWPSSPTTGPTPTPADSASPSSAPICGCPSPGSRCLCP